MSTSSQELLPSFFPSITCCLVLSALSVSYERVSHGVCKREGKCPQAVMCRLDSGPSASSLLPFVMHQVSIREQINKLSSSISSYCCLCYY